MTYDILGIGNAIMDVIAPVKDAFLSEYNIPKSGMQLIDEGQALTMDGALPIKHRTEIAGGSAANTIVGAAQCGSQTAYFGLVRDDEIGKRFATGMAEVDVDFPCPPRTSRKATARCYIAVTPDGERSMSTFLGASTEFTREDIQADAIRASKILYLEGYLFDSDAAKAAFVQAAEIARAAGVKTALTLSDSFCVDRHRASFRHLVDNHVDILFANEQEILSLYEVNTLQAAMLKVKNTGVLTAITRSEKGSIIIQGAERIDINAVPVDKVVDTTGAGDLYAAGFLAEYAKGSPLKACGKKGSALAARVIQQYGARLPD